MWQSWLKRLKIKVLPLRGSSLLLPVIPLCLSAIIGLFQAQFAKFAISLLACFCFSYAANRTRHYYRQLAQTIQSAQVFTNIEDTRPQGLLIFSLGVLILSAYLVRKPVYIAITTLAAAGIYYLHYMRAQSLPNHLDNPPQQNEVSHLPPTLQGMIRDGEKYVIKLLHLAHQYRIHRLPQAQALSENIQLTAMRAKLLISLCARQADNIRQLRPFFVVQLPEIVSICLECLQESDAQLEQLATLENLLNTVNQTFAEQSRALLAHDNFQLQSKMEVLRQQLENIHDQPE